MMHVMVRREYYIESSSAHAGAARRSLPKLWRGGIVLRFACARKQTVQYFERSLVFTTLCNNFYVS